MIHPTLFLQIVLAILRPVSFHIKFKISLHVSTKIFPGICRICIKPIDWFGKNEIEIFTILSLQSIFHLFRLIFFISICNFNIQIFYMFCFVPECFILFGLIVSGVVILISDSVCSLLVYRNAIAFFPLRENSPKIHY